MNTNYRPTVFDYRSAVSELSDFEPKSGGWYLQMRKIDAILAAMLVDSDDHNRCFAASQIEDELDTLSELDLPIYDPDVVYRLWMLDTFGFRWRADNIRDSWGENGED